MIRAAETAAELDAYARVWTEVHPENSISGKEVRRRFAEWDDGRRYFVAEAGGVAVGTGFASRTSSPGRAVALVAVLPEYRRRGIGSELLAASLRHARTFRASAVSGWLVEAALPWAERRGFEAFDREVHLVRDLAGEEEHPALPRGTKIGALREDEHEAAYRVYAEGVADIPSPVPLEPTFNRWWRGVQESPLVLVAREGGRIVGYAELGRQADDVLGHELTAVARTHRRRGIARALKQTQIAWAAERGYRRLSTDADWENVAIRRLNESLGYRALPPRIMVKKEL
jgi:GNAT superfamily N-acetyltransferase